MRSVISWVPRVRRLVVMNLIGGVFFKVVDSFSSRSNCLILKNFWACFSQTLDWVVEHHVDWEHGEWHRDLLENGMVSGDKANIWKGPYHNGRAMMICLDLLSSLQ